MKTTTNYIIVIDDREMGSYSSEEGAKNWAENFDPTSALDKDLKIVKRRTDWVDSSFPLADSDQLIWHKKAGEKSNSLSKPRYRSVGDQWDRR